MINANELRIGNWVREAEGMAVVRTLDDDYAGLDYPDAVYEIEYKDLIPIPITPDILVACGFEETKVDGNSAKFSVFTLSPLTYNSNHGWWLYGRKMDNQISYIHQLHNLYFALTGKELDVKL